MSRKQIVSCLVAVQLLLASVVPALAAETPEQVCAQYLAAIKQHGIVAMSEFIHPDEFARFKNLMMPIFEAGDAAEREDLRRGFFGESATPESVAAMPPADFTRAVMAVLDAQLKTKKVSFGNADVLGAVKEGEIVHMVTRASVAAGDVTLTQLEVVSLKPSGDTWRLLLSGQIEGMAQGLRARSARRPRS